MNSRSIIFAKMREGAMIITPNNRLSNQLLRDYMRSAPSNTSIVEKPLCLPYSQFLRMSYQQLQHQNPDFPYPLLLTTAQENMLWKQILGSLAAPHLLQQVQEASNRCLLWQIAMPFGSPPHTPQVQQFLAWHQAFVEHLQQRQWMVEVQLVPQLLACSFKPNFPVMVWVSFDDYTPQQQTLQAQLELMGCAQVHVDLKPRANRVVQYPAHDPRDELSQMIQWLQEQLSQGAQRIGVIVPDLQQQSNQINRRLQSSLRPEQFDISLGKPLTEFPLITHALHWLALDSTTLSHSIARLLLHSPYLHGAQAEFLARAELLESNLLLQEASIPFAAFVMSIQTSAPKLAMILTNLSRYPETASPAEWVQQFKTRLSSLGFPGEYPLDSTAYQYLQRLQGLFDEFLQLGLVQSEMTPPQAVDALRDLAQRNIFQVKKDPAPIQVSGLLEASGCEFDAIWVMGLTDQCLPERVNLSPFIPFSIQRQHHMPHALPFRELKLAQQLLKRLQYGASQVVFSYPKLIGDAPQLPSPLIQSLPHYVPALVHFIPDKTRLESYTDLYQYPVSGQESPSGGATLLANQAQCPFRAFAAHRLQAKRGLSQSTGLNDAERGQVIHRILETLWRQWQNQATLFNLPAEERESAIDQAIENLLAKTMQHRQNSCPSIIQTLEHQRLKQLVLSTLAWESQRPPFTVKAIETSYSLNLAGLELKLRVDRLDTVADDETWVIDYKSRLPSPKPWREERPETPQLLLYALLDPSIQTLLFLQVKTGQVMCEGISQTQHELPGLLPLKADEDWSTLQTQWQERLTQLAIEFKNGHCPPNPQRQTTCQHCEFIHLCRM